MPVEEGVLASSFVSDDEEEDVATLRGATSVIVAFFVIAFDVVFAFVLTPQVTVIVVDFVLPFGSSSLQLLPSITPPTNPLIRVLLLLVSSPPT